MSFGPTAARPTTICTGREIIEDIGGKGKNGKRAKAYCNLHKFAAGNHASAPRLPCTMLDR